MNKIKTIWDWTLDTHILATLCESVWFREVDNLSQRGVASSCLAEQSHSRRGLQACFSNVTDALFILPLCAPQDPSLSSKTWLTGGKKGSYLGEMALCLEDHDGQGREDGGKEREACAKGGA